MQVMQDNQDNQDYQYIQDNQDNLERLAHPWVDFRVTCLSILRYPASKGEGD